MIAFIKYDLFPYVVWGEVVDDSPSDGYIIVKNYGRFHLDSVERLLPQELGLEVADSVRQISIDFQDTKAALLKEYTDKLKAVIPWKE